MELFFHFIVEQDACLGHRAVERLFNKFIERLSQALAPTTNLEQLEGYVRCVLDGETAVTTPTADEWQELVTEDGHTYWFNEVTGVSQWERPR